MSLTEADDVKRFAVVISGAANHLQEHMGRQAIESLANFGSAQENIMVSWVTHLHDGVNTCAQMAASRAADAVIVLGSFFGDDPLPAHVQAKNFCSGVVEATKHHGTPVSFGVIVASGGENGLAQLVKSTIERACEEAVVAVNGLRQH